MTRSTPLPLLLVTLLAVACDKPDAQPKGPDPNTSATANATASASASASATATASASASASASATPTPTASATTSATPTASASAPPKASASASASAAGDAGLACGTKPLPDCPLQAWMKKNVNPSMVSADLPGLAEAFDKISKIGPPGYANWVSISKDGAAAARAQDLAAAKRACASCHEQYKAKYKSEIRTRPVGG